MNDERRARPAWLAWEWAALALTAAGLVLVAAWPVLRAPAFAPPDAEPVGVAVGVRDGLFYLSLIRQDVGASPVLRNPFADPGRDRMFWGTFWWGLAHARQLTGASPTAVFHAARYAAAAGCVLAIAWFATLCTTTRGARWLAIQLATWGSGLGWLAGLTGFNDFRSADLLTPETSTFYAAMSFPHIAGALALMVGCFAGLLAAVERGAARPWGWLAGLVALALGIFHPFNVLVVLGAWGLYACIALSRRDRLVQWVRVSWPVVLGCGFTIAFFAGVLALYPEGLPAETENRRPPYADLALGFGLLGLGAAVHVLLRIVRRSWDASFLLAAAWVIATAILLHSYPLLKQEGRAVLGLHVPLAVWTALAFMHFACRWPTAVRIAGGALLVFATLPTLFYVGHERTERMQSLPARYYVPSSEARAAEALAERVTAGDRIACSAWNGLVLGAKVPARIFRGKWDEPTAEEHDRALADLFGAETPPDVRRAVVERYGITVLWVGGGERATYSAPGLAAAVSELATDIMLDEGGVVAVRVAPPAGPS